MSKQETIADLNEQAAKDVEEMPVEFNGLMFGALDHGFESIEMNSGPLIPFVMTNETGGTKEMRRFVTERLEEGVEKAKEFIAGAKDSIVMYALAYDGYLTHGNAKQDAIFVEAGMKGKEKAFVLAQRYTLKGFFRKRNVKIGNPALVQQPPSRLI